MKPIIQLASIAAMAMLGCHTTPKEERAPVAECSSYLHAYGGCLRKSGMSEGQVVARLDTARGSILHAAGDGEAAHEALRARCAQASQQLGRVCR